MMVNLLDPILNYDGSTANDNTGKPATVRWVIWQALNTPDPAEPWNAETKMQAFNISVKIHAEPAVDLDETERALILRRSAAIDHPLVFGRLKSLLGDPVAAVAPEGSEPE